MAPKPRWPVKLTSKVHRELDLTLSSPSAPSRKEIFLNRKALRVKIKKEPETQAEAGDPDSTETLATSKKTAETKRRREAHRRKRLAKINASTERTR